jgi:hypothetical protein
VSYFPAHAHLPKLAFRSLLATACPSGPRACQAGSPLGILIFYLNHLLMQ